jgi:hypothetical protein
MAGDYKRERFSRSIGTGGAHDSMEVITHGKKRLEIDKDEPIVIMQPIESEPSAGHKVGSGGFFFRNRGDGKAQLCVKFPSGVVNIVCTED